MIVLTHSDARAYCLGVAQLIPVFLIALFVLDGGRFKKDAKKVTKASAKAEEEGKKALSGTKRMKRRLQRDLQRIDADISALDQLDLSQASQDELVATENARSDLMAMRAETVGSSEKLINLTEEMDRNLALAPTLRKDLKEATRHVVRVYAYYVVLLIFLGLAAEVVALWGAIGLINSLLAIAWATNLAILIAVSLSALSVDRLASASPQRFRFIQVSGIIAALIVSQTTFAWILLSVRVA